MTKKNVDMIFVVLTYKNTEDIVDLVKSIREKATNNFSYKVIIVNSFYDNLTNDELKKVSAIYNCDFYSIDNKGFSYGNNFGIDKAIENYNFKHLIISNPDILLKTLPYNKISRYDDGKTIIGPKISTLSGNNQNPFYHKLTDLSMKLLKLSAVTNFKIFMYISIVYSKFINNFSKIISNNSNIVDALHGAFIIIPYEVAKKSYDSSFKIFNNEMFLLAEELWLVLFARNNMYKFKYINELEVIHKEDGSMSGINDTKKFNYWKNSFTIFYDEYIKRRY
ncbi:MULTISPECIES: hypothetical protein [unclassified Exiguobacterium]|uniref:hypothetical protein n=1 Tax=unclassified Exiguobacterium TaxID=2644629 RepID=UPI001BE7DC8A|nr:MULTISPECIES: hypothetical protein [unclassified Exiguobacterium]